MIRANDKRTQREEKHHKKQQQKNKVFQFSNLLNIKKNKSVVRLKTLFCK